MLTLALLRHAKSSWDDPGMDDFQRPLSARGRSAAPLMGRWMADHGITPDAVLCSTSVRTRSTLALVLPELAAPAPKITYLDDLYLAPAPEMLDCIRGVAGSPRTLLVVGHNPGLHLLARTLAGHGPHELLSALRDKMPTAGLAVITFDAVHWADLPPGSGRLAHFISPRHLS